MCHYLVLYLSVDFLSTPVNSCVQTNFSGDCSPPPSETHGPHCPYKKCRCKNRPFLFIYFRSFSCLHASVSPSLSLLFLPILFFSSLYPGLPYPFPFSTCYHLIPALPIPIYTFYFFSVLTQLSSCIPPFLSSHPFPSLPLFFPGHAACFAVAWRCLGVLVGLSSTPLMSENWEFTGADCDYDGFCHFDTITTRDARQDRQSDSVVEM